MACPARRAVMADFDVLIDAPTEMTAWGYADWRHAGFSAGSHVLPGSATQSGG